MTWLGNRLDLSLAVHYLSISTPGDKLKCLCCHTRGEIINCRTKNHKHFSLYSSVSNWKDYKHHISENCLIAPLCWSARYPCEQDNNLFCHAQDREILVCQSYQTCMQKFILYTGKVCFAVVSFSHMSKSKAFHAILTYLIGTCLPLKLNKPTDMTPHCSLNS